MQHSRTDSHPAITQLRASILYSYWAVVVEVHDGDTISLEVDLGFDTWRHPRSHADDTATSFRLLGCNARELSQPGGPEARDHLAVLLPVGTVLRMASVRIKDDKYGGRYDAAVLLADGTDLVAQLVDQQWAAAWDGTGTKPVPPWPRTVTP